MAVRIIPGTRPTRIELQRLRKRREVAERGRDLLEDQLNSMLLEFFQRYARYQADRAAFDAVLADAYSLYRDAEMVDGRTAIREAGYTVPDPGDLPLQERSVLGLRVPALGDAAMLQAPGYCPVGASPHIVLAAARFSRVLHLALLLGEEEEALRALERSITRTRRKVNAMDRVLIPRIVETLRYIEEQLEEQEREDLYRRKITRAKKRGEPE
ncbi:V-type ATP synthase subunit D [anaerobic digester metagenome]|uniref:V-type ATP synthase subunit D n=1 Tax=Methanoculleus sp. TaxID=90427 RepID=UPI0025F17E46|nr:V-type ATP synthase subunit D [Methanoculleus sp.]MCK9319268.1 V-type ATP synthase subunit D [Methanoculleus sp.]MDD4315356.1 V-type ATP synthase subunit D [Methanoculleus sp.]